MSRRSHKSWSDKETAEAMELYHQGLALDEMAEELCRSPASVSYFCYKQKIPLPPPSGRTRDPAVGEALFRDAMARARKCGTGSELEIKEGVYKDKRPIPPVTAISAASNWSMIGSAAALCEQA